MQAVRGLTFSYKTSSSSSSSSAAASLLRYHHSKTVFAAISNSIHGSNIHCRGRSHVALVSSDSAEPQPRGKRVTKDERRAMIKAFVDKYRAENAGKYPPPKATQKQVGGSYYVVRNILQELEYSSKQSTTSSKVTSEPQLEDNEPKEEFTPSQEVKEGPSSKTRTGLTYPTKRLDRKDNSQTVVVNSVVLDEVTSYTFEAEVENLGSTEMPHLEDTLNTNTTSDSSYSDVLLNSNEPELVQEAGFTSDKSENKEVSCLSSEEPDNSEKKTAISDVPLDIYEPELVQEVRQEFSESNELEKKEVSRICTDEVEDSEKKTAISDVSLDLNEQKLVEEGEHGASESDKLGNKKVSHVCNEEAESSEEKPASATDQLEIDGPKKENEEQQLRNTSTLWGNLRSFADGIINLWRKM